MKQHVRDFLRRGSAASSIGPIVLAVLYLVLERKTGTHTLTVREVCTGILSLSALAFLAGGMNFIYQIERLPLMPAILIHGAVLYAGYLLTYLVNDWLEWGMIPVLVFSGIFVLGYLAIWAIIYSIMKRRTEQLNQALRQMRKDHPAG